MGLFTDILVVVLCGVVLAGAVIWAVVSRIRDKKKGKASGCNGDCSHCKGCDR